MSHKLVYGRGFWDGGRALGEDVPLPSPGRAAVRLEDHTPPVRTLLRTTSHAIDSEKLANERTWRSARLHYPRTRIRSFTPARGEIEGLSVRKECEPFDPGRDVVRAFRTSTAGR